MNRTIMITGATGKLGKVFVNYFLNKGDKVVAVSRSKNKLDLMQSENLVLKKNLFLIEIDLMSNNFEELILEKLREKDISPCCLVNNARSMSNLLINDFGSVDEKKMLDEYKLGVIVPYKLTIALLRNEKSLLKKVVNVGSIYGEVAPNRNLKDLNPDPIHYGLTKAALSNLTKQLAVRFADKNININCISYGGVEGSVDESFVKKYSRLCPSGRMLNQFDLAGPLDMLLSNDASGINGHILMVDGGWTIW